MRHLVDLLAPSLCDGCDARAAPPWCDACADLARAMRPSRPCPRCAGTSGAGHPCWSGTAPVVGLVALTAWHDPVARVVLRAKLDGRREVMVALGRRLAPLLGEVAVDAVVPVPTAPSRVRQRGADHTRSLGHGLAQELAVPAVAALRTGRGSADRGLADAAGRGALPVGALVPTARSASLAGRRVALVDDLVTTGGTLAAAARALTAAGVAEVHAAVVARAGRHHLTG